MLLSVLGEYASALFCRVAAAAAAAVATVAAGCLRALCALLCGGSARIFMFAGTPGNDYCM